MVMQPKSGFKQTEVGAIPEDWKVRPLRDISSLKGRIGWQGLKQSEFTMKDDEPFLITGMNFKDGEIDWAEVYHVSEERYAVAKDIQLQNNDVLMTKDGTIGKLLFVDEIPFPKKATLNSHLLLFRPIGKSYYPKFLYYQLASRKFKEHIELNKTGSTFFGISQEAVGTYLTILPPFLEQIAIAHALSDVDSLIETLNKLIEKKINIKQGAMQEFLTGKKRLPSFNGEWKTKKLKETADIYNGGTPNTKIKEYWDGSIFWCIPTDITQTKGKYLFETGRKITKAGLENSSAKLLPIGTLLLCSRATVGEVKISKVEVATNQGFKSLVCFNDVNNEFVYYKLLTIKNKLIEKSIGSTFLEISKRDTESIEISIAPTKREQSAIAKVLSDIDSEIEALEQKRNKYKQLKMAMMQELLTGRIRLKWN